MRPDKVELTGGIYMTEQDRESFETIIEAFGKEAQMIVAVEELAELQKEIIKKLRQKKGNIFSLVEEMADAEGACHRAELQDKPHT